MAAWLGQSSPFPAPNATELWAFIIPAISIGVLIAVYWQYRANRKRAEEGDEPKRRILPEPIVTREDDPFVRRSEFDAQVQRRSQQVIELEKRIDARMEKHENYVHENFRAVRNELNAIKLEGEDRGEKVTETLGNIYDKLNACCVTIAKVEERANQIPHMQQQLERIIEREIDGRTKR